MDTPTVGTAARARSYAGDVRARYAGELMLATIVLLWGFGYVANRYSVTHGWEPLALPALRYVGAALFFSLLVLRVEGTLRVARADVARVVIAALVLGVANQAAFHHAIDLAAASTVALVFGTLPIMAAIFTHLIDHERLRGAHWLATAVSFGGVTLIAAGSGGALAGSLGGILLALGGAATFALYSVLIAPLSATYSPYRIAALVTLIAVVPLNAIAAPQIARMDFGALGGLAWAASGYTLAMFMGTAVLWYRALERVGPAHATLWVNMQPFAGVVFGVLVLSETLTSLEIVGAVVIAASIVLSRWRHTRQEL